MTDRAEAIAAAKAIAELKRRERECRLDFFTPYPKQAEFLGLGATKRERALIAANRSGKTFCAAAEVAMHLTGMYPSWWVGKRFDGPNHWWAASQTGILVRDGAQSELFGKANVADDRGTGMVPKHLVRWDRITSMHGYSGLYDTVQVKHVSGGISTCQMMTYMQARETWQAVARHGIWCDEEPPEDLYNEGLTRLATTNGIMICTFTPLMGRSKVVLRYVSEPSVDRAYVNMTIDDAKHFTPEQREKIVAGYASYERAARARGEPMLGAGRIFETDEVNLLEQPVKPIPPYWKKLWAIDLGTEHPFAAVLLAHDPDGDVTHVVHAFKMRDTRPIDHASAMKPWGADIPVAWPHDGHIRERGSVEPVMHLYKQAGLKMLPSHAAFPDGSISTEAGIRVMDDRMKSGRFKVANHLSEWLEEYRHYHRKPKQDGTSEIVKQNDDLMSATRIGCMALRYARAVDAEWLAREGKTARVAKDVDFPIFGDYGGYE